MQLVRLLLLELLQHLLLVDLLMLLLQLQRKGKVGYAVLSISVFSYIASVWTATWRSGDAADCKSAYPGSIPGVASKRLEPLLSPWQNHASARFRPGGGDRTSPCWTIDFDGGQFLGNFGLLASKSSPTDCNI